MKVYEALYRCAEPFLPPLHGLVRRRLMRLPAGARVLDVGGRRSNYTIGLDGSVTVTDLPRATPLQEQLHLGLDGTMIGTLRRRRSNIEAVIFDDMTCSALPDAAFDVAVAVEVLEHVEEEARFVAQVARVLRPGGTFLMTTPNGDYVENHNPDHQRHYRKRDLQALLANHFEEVEVEYAIATGRWRKRGLRSWSAGAPVRTLLSMTGNVVNRIQSRGAAVRRRARGTHHLIAEARKRS